MKVSELTGAQLDYWVAKAEEKELPFIRDDQCYWCYHEADMLYSPSSDWSLGGPIIEREIIMIMPPRYFDKWDNRYRAQTNGGFAYAFGDSQLEAAMRCYVASRFGDEVSDELA